PSGYPAVISAPSSRTRSAMRSWSKTMRLTVLPDSLGSAIEIVTDVGHNRPTGPYGCRVTAADSWNPDDLLPREDYGPPRTDVSGNPRVGEEIPHLSSKDARSALTQHAVARSPRTHAQRLVGRKPSDPGIVPYGLARRRARKGPTVPDESRGERLLARRYAEGRRTEVAARLQAV